MNTENLGAKAQSEIQWLQQSRESLADDPFRPLYHLSSPLKKMWDPGGFCEWNGKYHLFYINQGAKGHAVSDDINYTQSGDDLACPNFLPIGHGRHLLLWFNHPRDAMYLIGAYDKEKQKQKFVPEYHGRMSYGPVLLGTLHAPSAFVDSLGRCFTIFNVSENRPHRGGWIGTMSLPRQISLHEDYQENPTSAKPRNFFSPFRIEPPAALESLRFDPVEVKAIDISANEEVVFADVKGKAIEIEAVIDPTLFF